MPQVETDAVAEIIGHYHDHRASLIPILQEVQAKYFYLPEPVLRQVAARLDIAMTDVYHVATFYNCFSLEPVGKHLAQVCLGTACHVRGAPKVLDRTLQELNLSKPGTTKDCEFTVRTVRCIGCCGLAPVVRVGDNVHPHMTQAKVKGMLNKYRKQEARPVQ